jgi:hypothetical protein
MTHRTCPKCRTQLSDLSARDFESLPTRDREAIIERYFAVRRGASSQEPRRRLAVFEAQDDGSVRVAPAPRGE